VFETLPIILDHQNRTTVFARSGCNPIADARLSVGKDVAEQCIDDRSEILGAEANRQPATRRVNIDRSLLLVRKHFPESCPLSDNRSEI
jgi:hypothetical protein